MPSDTTFRKGDRVIATDLGYRNGLWTADRPRPVGTVATNARNPDRDVTVVLDGEVTPTKYNIAFWRLAAREEDRNAD